MTAMPPMIALKQGDRIEIRCDGRCLEGMVIFGSENGLSLMIGYEAILRGFVGMMPVSWEGGRWMDLGGKELEIRKIKQGTGPSAENTASE